MEHRLHFISGLPRAGSTLLSALLRQNPTLRTGMTSPVGVMFQTLLRSLSPHNEGAVFIDDQHRDAVLRGLFRSYYEREHARGQVVLDTSRIWCAHMPALARLFPQARVIACVREVQWVMDSLERLIQRNALQPSGIFGFEPGGTVYSRTEGLGAGSGMVGHAYNALRQACYGEQTDRLLLLRYETLTAAPARALAAIYEFLDLPPFAHDPDRVTFEDGREFDARLGTPGLHDVGARVAAAPRRTILPPDLFARYESDSFWNRPEILPPGLRVV
jgi:sulfotransferase